MKILLIGPDGQLGWELCRALAPLGQVCPLGLHTQPALDLAQPDHLRAALRAFNPQWIVNASAYTAVDRAEEEIGLAMAVNADAPGILAEEAKRTGAALIHYSTDYVFDGAQDRPYREDDPPRPANAYGVGKLAGEQAVEAVGGAYWILRTSWLYGARGQNFLRTMLRLGAERDELKVVDDQRGSPTWCRMVAEATAQMLAQTRVAGAAPAAGVAERTGVYHVTCAGETTWCGFAGAIFSRTAAHGGKGPRVVPIPTDAYPTPARRPAYSVLSNTRLRETFGLCLPPWEEALGQCLEDMGYPPG
ncbi:MAG: dTDP-4-dehydrorhamnose reductase [Gammaproteobacteria bacterium]